MPKPLTVWIITNCGTFLKRLEYQTILPASWDICMQVRKQQLELDMEQRTGSKFRKEYVRVVYCHPAYLTYMLSEWVSENCSVVSDSLWNFPYQNTEVGSLSLLQGIFPTQGSNPGFPNCRWILYQLSHKGSPICRVHHLKCLARWSTN